MNATTELHIALAKPHSHLRYGRWAAIRGPSRESVQLARRIDDRPSRGLVIAASAGGEKGTGKDGQPCDAAGVSGAGVELAKGRAAGAELESWWPRVTRCWGWEGR